MATILTYLVAPGPWGLYRAELLCDLLAHYDYTPDDLVDAYWAKSEENLRRWQAAADPEVPAKPEPQFMYVPSMDPSYSGMIVPIVPDSATPEELAEADHQLRQWALYVLIALFVAGCLALAWMVSGGTL